MSSGSGTGTPITPPVVGSATSDDQWPLMPLDQWRQLMGVNPWHFWRIAGAKVPITSGCSPLTFSYPWQYAEQASRDDIRRALVYAERVFAQYARFNPATKFERIKVSYPDTGADRAAQWQSFMAGGRWQQFLLPLGEIQKIGAEAWEFIGTFNVSLSDNDGDGLQEAFSLTAPATCSADEIEVYFGSADRFDGSSIGPRWKIAPVRATVAGGVATIKGGRWLLAKPALQEALDSKPIEESNANNFATSVDVWRHYVDTTVQGQFVWPTRPMGCGSCPDVSTGFDPSAYYVQSARFGVRNARLGAVFGESAAPSLLAEDWVLGYPPDYVEIYTYSGIPTSNGVMSQDTARTIARFATAEIARAICGCEGTMPELARWQKDLAVSGGDESVQLAFGLLGNPFGTRQGQVYAWQQVQELTIAQAVLSN